MEYYRTGKQDGRGNGSWGGLCSASGISDQFSTLNSRQASTSDSQSVAVQSPRHWSAQRREKCLFRNQIVENRPEPLDDLTPRVLEPRSSSNFPLSRNFDPSPFVNPSSSPSSLDSSYSIYIYIYIRSSNQPTTRRGRRSLPSPPFQLSFRRIESPRIGFQPGKIAGETSEISRSVSSPKAFGLSIERTSSRTGMRRDRALDVCYRFSNK